MAIVITISAATVSTSARAALEEYMVEFEQERVAQAREQVRREWFARLNEYMTMEVRDYGDFRYRSWLEYWLENNGSCLTCEEYEKYFDTFSGRLLV